MKVVVHYDHKTQVYLAKFKKVLEEYEKELICQLGLHEKHLSRLSLETAHYRFQNDINRKIILEQIDKVTSLSIPTSIELIHEKGDNGYID